MKRRFNLPVKSNTSYLSNHTKKTQTKSVKSPSTIRNKETNLHNNSKMNDESKLDQFNSNTNSFSIKQKTPLNYNNINSNQTNPSDYKRNSRPSSSSNIRSPNSNHSTRCHRYHTDLDYNYLADKNFYNDANNVVKRNLSSDKFTNKKSNSNAFSKVKNNESNMNIYSADTLYSNETNNESALKINKNSNLANSFSKEKKKSVGVLGDVLDAQFSINSPSRKKMIQNEMDQIRSDEFRRKINSNHEGNKDKIYNDDEQNNKVTINLSFVGESPQEKFIEALENIMVLLDPIFDRLTLSDKIEKFLENTNDSRRVIK